jgi:hypothetical protein
MVTPFDHQVVYLSIDNGVLVEYGRDGITYWERRVPIRSESRGRITAENPLRGYLSVGHKIDNVRCCLV